MYLKSIEIQGFKSFANRISLEFHNGITAIVGPNGSGKSNIADAVRWVLGEQSAKQLRGSSMQDVIFAGTQLRRPLGFARVAITFDNTGRALPVDYDEVVVSRRLYRSGESEYALNGSLCRLRDIQELFYDTGIGKEGYSLIGQGQIEKILSGRPEERRELFDEAAGIVKFKRRKLEAQRKLDAEQQNLIRAGDILSELERQEKPLAGQAGIARRYLALYEDLKKSEAVSFFEEERDLKMQLAEFSGREELLLEDKKRAAGQEAACRALYESLETEAADLDRQISETKARKSGEQLKAETLRGRTGVLSEQIRSGQAAAAKNRDKEEQTKAALAEKTAGQQTYLAERESLLAQRAAVSAQIEDLKSGLLAQDEDIRLLDEKLTGAKNRILTGLDEKAGLSAREQKIKTIKKQLLDQLESLKEQKEQQAGEAERLLALCADKERELKAARQESGRLFAAQSGAEQAAAEAKTAADALEQQLRESQGQADAAKNRLDTLQDLAERYEGYGAGVRRVMEAGRRFPGVKGVAADLITTDKKYETAVETALGAAIQNVVTDTERTAKRLIAWLKENRYGRVTFLPLDAIGAGRPFSRPEVLKEPGVIGLAGSLVRADAAYAGLVDHLLGRVVVADNIDDAVALAGKYHYSLRIVTLEGELLSPGGSITGGAYKNTGNLLGRKREIAELKKTCARLRTQSLRLLTGQKEGTRTLLKRQEELDAIREQRQQSALTENTLTLELSQLKEKKAQTDSLAAALSAQEEALAGRQQDAEEEERLLLTDSEVFESRHRQADEEAADLEKRLLAGRSAREQTAGQLEKCRLSEAALAQKADFAEQNRRRLEEEGAELAAQLAELAGQDEKIRRQTKEKEAELAALEKQIRETESQAESLTGQENTLLLKKEETAGRRKQAVADRQEAADQLSLLERDILRIQNQKERLSQSLDAQIKYLWDEYGLTPETARPLAGTDRQSKAALKRQTQQLRNEIRALGPVNVGAIEQHREIAQRRASMKEQYDDLTEATAALLRIIENLDTGMRRQFAERFERIRESFSRVFQELFGGGSADLALVADEDVLEAGVQVIVQPPGKKLQNMMQLSGGEKALTAICLLFAIQNLKPSPFCLLDEIEAALDDPNVNRFGAYLQKLAADTQFIVITHRRGTMVAADRLYGITMQEKGVSALVSVSLVESELD